MPKYSVYMYCVGYALELFSFLSLADLEEGYRGCKPPPPFQITKIKQKIEDNPFEKEDERKSCMHMVI